MLTLVGDFFISFHASTALALLTDSLNFELCSPYFPPLTPDLQAAPFCHCKSDFGPAKYTPRFFVSL